MAGKFDDLMGSIGDAPLQDVKDNATIIANDNSPVTVSIGKKTGSALQARIIELHNQMLEDQRLRILSAEYGHDENGEIIDGEGKCHIVKGVKKAKKPSTNESYKASLKLDRTQKKLNNVKLSYFAGHEALRESGYTDSNFEKYILEALDEKLTRDLNSHLS